MKKLLIFFLFVMLSSCCTQEGCEGAFDIQEVELIAFDSLDVDSIYVTSYLKGTNFSVLVNEAYTSASKRFGDDGNHIIFMPIELTELYDYQFVFLNIGKTYSMSGIKSEMEKCNICFLASDKYKTLSEYTVNGETTYYGAFQITK